MVVVAQNGRNTVATSIQEQEAKFRRRKKIMRNTRKGFTLVELLLVIGIIAILGSMGLVGGREATSIAEAQKIVENFHLISSAMNMYYADNTAAIAKDDNFATTTIRTGIKPYIKDISVVAEGTTATAGKFLILFGSNDGTDVKTEWWLQYTLGTADSKIADILANKAVQEGFKKTASEGTEAEPNTYEANTTVESTTTFNKDIFLRVR